MDDETIAAGLLHDVIEDCGVTRDQLAAEFGAEIADLVDGVTKLKLADFEQRELGKAALPESVANADAESPEHAAARKKRHGETNKSAANLRKILLAMAKDLRVMVIKLADRLHNMRTPPAPEARRKKSRPGNAANLRPRPPPGNLASNGSSEDLAFKVNPTAYNEIKQKLDRTRSQRDKEINTSVALLKTRLEDEGIHAEINGRPKHLYPSTTRCPSRNSS